MGRTIICTVGTSLLTNRDERPWAGWSSRSEKPPPKAADIVQWMSSVEPSKASAETNTLYALQIDATDRLALLHSDTPDGQLCARALADYYRQKVRAVSLERIGKLGYGADEFSTGLKALVDIALRLVREARDRSDQPIFCATGGFKAEIAFLNLLGALLEIEVVYIHEFHRKLVRLPRLPLVWDAELVARHQKFFLWIDEEPRPSGEVESWLGAHAELRSLVEDDGEGHTLLTAAGDLLFKAATEQLSMGPRATWPNAHPATPSEKNHVSKEEHHRPAGWQRYVEHLCQIDCVAAVRYDAQAYGGQQVHVLDAAAGALGVRFGPPGNELPLRVETTAVGLAQCELVAAYLRRRR